MTVLRSSGQTSEIQIILATASSKGKYKAREYYQLYRYLKENFWIRFNCSEDRNRVPTLLRDLQIQLHAVFCLVSA
jgi:hypothetical protein